MRKKNNYPDWVEKYREKGKTIRKVRDGYGLYKCTSTYVKGSKYPKLNQEYLGMITKKDGFIPKIVISMNPIYIEYGLSTFIVSNFWRDIKRALYQPTDDLVYLGIILFIFNSTNDYFIHHCVVTTNKADTLISYREKISEKRIKTVTNVISKIFKAKIPDEEERIILLSGLRLCVKEEEGNRPPALPESLKEIIERNGLKTWKND